MAYFDKDSDAWKTWYKAQYNKKFRDQEYFNNDNSDKINDFKREAVRILRKYGDHYADINQIKYINTKDGVNGSFIQLKKYGGHITQKGFYISNGKLTEIDFKESLVGRLKKINCLLEDWSWAKVNNTDTEYAKNPLPKEYWQFLREKKELRAINDEKNNWYFWAAENGIHAQFAKKVLGFDINDLSTSFKHHMYQIRINKNNQMDHYLFSQLIGFFEYEEYTFDEIKQYMAVLFKRLLALKPYHITFTNKAYAMCKEIVSGEAFE